MKKQLVELVKKMREMMVLTVLPFVVIAQKPFQLSGTGNALKTGDKIYLLYYSEGKNLLDSATVTAGRFLFKGLIPEPAKGRLYLNANPLYGKNSQQVEVLPLFLEPGQTRLIANESLKNAVFINSRINSDSRKLDSLIKPFDDLERGIISELEKMSSEQQQDKSLLVPLHERGRKITAECNAVYQQFAKNNPKSFISLIAIRQLAADIGQAKKAMSSYNALDGKLKKTETGKNVGTLLRGTLNTTIGVMAMNFTLTDMNGKQVRLSDFRGKYVLLDFWASWCVPCRAEIPNVVKAYNLYKEQNFTVLGVSLDEPGKKDAWLQAIKKDGAPWTQVSDLKGWNSEAAKLYAINSIPASFLIDPSGKIIAKNIRGEELHKKLAEIFRSKIRIKRVGRIGLTNIFCVTKMFCYYFCNLKLRSAKSFHS